MIRRIFIPVLFSLVLFLVVGAAVGSPSTATELPFRVMQANKPLLLAQEEFENGIIRISNSYDGGSPNGGSSYPQISANGRYIVYQSSANNIVPNDTNGYNDVFLYDRETGLPKMVSIGYDGQPANGSSGGAQISANGEFIAYTSSATNLTPNSNIADSNVFIYEIATGITTQILLDLNQRLAFNSYLNNTAVRGVTSISADGRYLGLTTLYNTNGFVYDRHLGIFDSVGNLPDGSDAGAHESNLHLSALGDKVIFAASKGTLANGTNQFGGYEGFIRQTFVNTHTTRRVTVSTDGTEAEEGTLIRSITADGNIVAFTTLAGLRSVEGTSNTIVTDTNQTTDLFIRNHVAGETKRIPIEPYYTPAGMWGSFINSIRTADLSSDGSHLVFQSGNNNLDPIASTNTGNLYLYDLESHPQPTFELITIGHDGNAADGGSDYPQFANGHRFVVFVSAATNLVENDDNGVSDIFLYDHSTDNPSLIIDKFLEPPKETDERFVAFSWPTFGISTTNNIVFNIDIDRYYFHPESVDRELIEFKENGRLTADSIRTLIDNGAFPDRAKLEIAIYDVDESFGDSARCPQGENPIIVFNDEPLTMIQNGNLTPVVGQEQGWVVGTYDVPLKFLKVPSAKGENGIPPKAASNKIELLIPPHCTDGIVLGWAAISLTDVIRPILTIPGWTDHVDENNLYSDEYAFFTFYTNFGLYSHLPIQVPKNFGSGILSVNETYPMVINRIYQTKTEFGVDKVNVFGHSRGGIFIRKALAISNTYEQVEHVVTFSTPHHGSVPNKEDGVFARIKCRSKFSGVQFEQCLISANSMTLDQMRVFNFSSTCSLRALGRQVFEWYDCDLNPNSSPQGDVKYYSIASTPDGVIGGLYNTRKEETAIYPWWSWNWQEFGIPFPSEHEIDEKWDYLYECDGFFDETTSLRWIHIHYTDCHKESARAQETFCFAVQQLFGSLDEDILVNGLTYIGSCKGVDIGQHGTINERAVAQNHSNQNLGSSNATHSGNWVGHLDTNQTEAFQLPISATEYAVVTLQTYPLVNDYLLYDPEGNLVVVNEITVTQNIITNTDYGNFYQLQLNNPIAGYYNFQFANALTTTIYYAVSVVVSDTTSLQTWANQFDGIPNDTITITALLDGYTDLVTITADITDPDGLTQTIQLSKNISASNPVSGYVVYDGPVTLSTAEGFHEITTRAEAGYMVRLANTSIAVYSRTAQIGAVTQVTTPDIDNDGLYDSIDFDVELDVLREGYYALFAELVGPNGSIGRTNFSSRVTLSATLPISTHLITLSIPGELVYESRQSGPYTLTNVTAIDENGFGFTVDTRDNLTATATYLPQQFEGERTVTLENITYETDDENDNGLYDTIQFTLTADSQLTGTFRVSGRLVDENDGTIGWANSEITITDTGSITPTLIFSGSQISSHQVHGEYALRDLNMLSVEGTGWYQSDLTTTIPYSYTQFEGIDQLSINDLAVIYANGQFTITWPDMGLNYEVWLTSNPYTGPTGDCLSQAHCITQAVNQFVLHEADIPDGLQTVIVIGIHNGLRTQIPATTIGSFKFSLQSGGSP